MPPELEIRERILEHSCTTFLAKGFSKVTLDELASDLGVSKKTLYKFYPSKEELLRASLHEMMRSAGWELERIVSSDVPFVDKLTTAMMTMSKYISRVRRESLLDFQRFVPSLWRELDRFRKEHIISRLLAMVSQAKGENILRPEVNEEVLLLMLLSSLQGVINPEVLSQHSFSADEGAKSIFTILFEGALTDEARKGFHGTAQSTEFV